MPVSSALITAAAALALVTATEARTFKSELKTEDADFSYSWSPEVSAIPELLRRFSADLRKERAATIAGGKGYNAMRKQMGDGPIGYMHSSAITTAGQSGRLLSLRIDVGEFIGGAHGNHGTGSLIWDRHRVRELKFGDLFQPRASYAPAIRTPYCKRLDAERRKRRGGDGKIGGGVTEFDSCPPLSALAAFPADDDRDGRFERIRLVASPYTAGPYAEGEYDLEVPVTRGLIGMLKPGYRASFEA